MREPRLSPNEKELLGYFKEVDESNAVTLSKKMSLSLHYTQTLCDRLSAAGVLSVVTPGRWTVYTANGKEVKKKRAKVAKRRKVVLKPKAEVKCGYCQGKGTDRWGLMSVLSDCQVCKGNGTVKIEEPYITCPACKGQGSLRTTRLTCLSCKGKGVVHLEKEMKTCPVCKGTGKEGRTMLTCFPCRGKGVVYIENGMKTCSVCGGSAMTGSVGLRKYCLKCHGLGSVRA